MFIAPEQLPDLLVKGFFLGDDRCFATARAVVHAATHFRNADPPALCLTCPTEISDGTRIGLFAVLRAEAEKPELALGSAICLTCCSLSDLIYDVYEMY